MHTVVHVLAYLILFALCSWLTWPLLAVGWPVLVTGLLCGGFVSLGYLLNSQ